MTETYIRDLVYIYKNTGEIREIKLTPINYPAEGDDPENEYLYIKYLMSDFEWPIHTTNAMEFMERYYWDFGGKGWVFRGKKPNPYAFWTTNYGWDWDDQAFLNAIRLERNAKLAGSDWTQVADAPITAEQVAEATAYRQALRDMTSDMIENPQNYPNNDSIPWPVAPTFLA